MQPGRSLNHLQDGRTPRKKIAAAVPGQQAATIDNVAAVETFFVNRSCNLKLPLTR
ncbi:hypothetical protein JWG42_13385 [Desulfoprunum benzoelyticum]|uniref:Uncharacterized protein n=1 Tax=Desulfoprunum benzoelyticum TaxID=1506996 RepID=A0A840UQD3_9BACT|nr:hypothetical protein [Desulfoprunum benzoelyticum]MBB5346813.1 hypothetical protein [Desulfoprunum benzoelyticum]MBM9531146.1 hypothetical protein [Desulfoprunum benzoelyticum]